MPIYGGYLKNWEVLQDFPEMAQEALLWPQATLIAWQSISLYYRVPEVHHLGVGKHWQCCIIKLSRFEGNVVKID